jgi:23S rRNA (cytidine1920-2'-O)/16S rRNA (cytidine1409-2'-O)-methyltransferase
MVRKRLDELLVEKGLCSDRDLAMRWVMAGEVLVDGRTAVIPGLMLEDHAKLQVKTRRRSVSRGGLKLEEALRTFGVCLDGKIAADVGASTGGFTDCALQHGAARVYAIDVGTGVLAWTLRTDDRVIAMEGINAIHLHELPEQIDVVTMDLSLTSLRLVLPSIPYWMGPGGEAIALVKPQYEALSESQLVSGVVSDPLQRRCIVLNLMSWVQRHRWRIRGLIASPIRGRGGNQEYLVHLDRTADQTPLTRSELASRVSNVIPV